MYTGILKFECSLLYQNSVCLAKIDSGDVTKKKERKKLTREILLNYNYSSYAYISSCAKVMLSAYNQLLYIIIFSCL